MTERLQQLVLSYWPAVVGLIAVAAAWGTSTAQIAAVQASNAVIIAKQDKMADQISGFAASIASAQATELAMAATVSDLRERVRAVEARR